MCVYVVFSLRERERERESEQIFRRKKRIKRERERERKEMRCRYNKVCPECNYNNPHIVSARKKTRQYLIENVR